VSIKDVPAPESFADASADRPVVLVVDDEPAIADMLSEILNRNGYAAITAYHGIDALGTALLVPPEMVITDIGLPGMSGIEVATVLRKELPDCKVLLLAGQGAAARPLPSSNGAALKFELVEKPVHPDVLLTRVSSILASK
jgi:DNA-binding response OmpR family regulator